jgi:hypothetical protein
MFNILIFWVYDQDSSCAHVTGSDDEKENDIESKDI